MVSASSLSLGATGAITGAGAGAATGGAMVEANEATSERLPAASTATALTVFELATLIAFEYAGLDAVGSDPSVVYRIVPSDALSDTFCAPVYVPAATLAVGADGAVASLLTRPLTVLPAPMLYVLAILIAPSVSPESCAAGTVAVHVPTPLAGAATVLPVESISVIPVALAPGWETPVTVRSDPTLATLMSERLAPLASFGAYAPAQPGTLPGVAPAS